MNFYQQDGTLGDLYPLAITLADELCTVFTDVLDGLEQLRKRQLPAQTYDQMTEVFCLNFNSILLYIYCYYYYYYYY